MLIDSYHSHPILSPPPQNFFFFLSRALQLSPTSSHFILASYITENTVTDIPNCNEPIGVVHFHIQPPSPSSANGKFKHSGWVALMFGRLRTRACGRLCFTAALFRTPLADTSTCRVRASSTLSLSSTTKIRKPRRSTHPSKPPVQWLCQCYAFAAWGGPLGRRCT